jgi:hypothetical protein
MDSGTKLKETFVIEKASAESRLHIKLELHM